MGVAYPSAGLRPRGSGPVTVTSPRGRPAGYSGGHANRCLAQRDDERKVAIGAKIRACQIFCVREDRLSLLLVKC